MKQFKLAIDLDGTLIDSKRTVHDALQYALRKNNIGNDSALSSINVGPPLTQIIESVCPDASIDLIQQVSESFMQVYDERYCLACDLYPGAKDVVRSLCRKFDLLLVTNKRIRPTKKILKYFELDSFFSHVIGCDSLHPSSGEKADNLVHLIEHGYITRENCWYLGDTIGDALACYKVGLPFVHAAWGYCEEGIESSLVSSTASNWLEILSLPPLGCSNTSGH